MVLVEFLKIGVELCQFKKTKQFQTKRGWSLTHDKAYVHIKVRGLQLNISVTIKNQTHQTYSQTADFIPQSEAPRDPTPQHLGLRARRGVTFKVKFPRYSFLFHRYRWSDVSGMFGRYLQQSTFPLLRTWKTYKNTLKHIHTLHKIS